MTRRPQVKTLSVRKALESVLGEPGKSKAGAAFDLVRDLVGCVAGLADLSVNKAYIKTFGR